MIGFTIYNLRFTICSPALLLSLLLLLSFASCKEEKPIDQYGEGVKKVFFSSEKIFRGLNMGDPIDAVKKVESRKAQEEDKNYLFYEDRQKTGDIETVEYNFDEAGLNEIRYDAYFIITEDARTLFNDIRAYLKDKYGESEDYYGFSGWSFEQDDRQINIELKDESAEYRQGKISLIIYEFELTAPKPSQKLN
jgi:hypothetical protein